MEIHQSNEAWVEEDGELTFDHTKTTATFTPASPSARMTRPQSTPPGSTNAGSTWTASGCPPSLTSPPPRIRSLNTYFKKPRLLYYDDTPASRNLGALMLGEIEVCEVLGLNPHPNIARYPGRLTSKGKVTGLCFAKYSTTLAQRLREGNAFDKHACFRGIEAGTKHMHALSLIHNDLNPSNVMFDGREPVIIDFDLVQNGGRAIGAQGRHFRLDH
ncbi:hypothetical protein RB595_007923 [Gaeumannomyces hyphopodioides]